MNRIGIVGVTWRDGGSRALARWTLLAEDRARSLRRLARHLGAAELLYLATCNRVEIAFVNEDGTAKADIRSSLFETVHGRSPVDDEADVELHCWQGEAAVEHLLVVAAGLDSAQVGEREIRGQLRGALQTAHDLELGGPLLDWAVGEALRLARRIHRETALGAGRLSLSEIGLGHVRRRLRRTPGAVALVGVSKMTRQSAVSLARHGTPIIVVNRTPERAAALAKEHAGEWRSLEQFCQSPDAVEALVLATASSEPVIDTATLRRLSAATPSGEPPLIVDLAIPADVDSDAAAAIGVPVVTIDQITDEAAGTRERRSGEITRASELIDEALIDLRRQLVLQRLSPVVAGLSQRYRETVVEGVETLFRKDLSHLGEDEQQAVRRWAEAMARRLAHIPTVGVRALAVHCGADAVRTFLAASEDALSRELLAAAESLDDVPAARNESLAEDHDPEMVEPRGAGTDTHKR